MSGNTNILLRNWLFIFSSKIKKGNFFSDWECWNGLNDDISFDEYEGEFIELKYKQFDLTRENFKEIVKSIPYMFIEKYLVCPCSFKFKDHFFHLLGIVPPISPFKCNCDTVFNNKNDLLRHLKPSQLIRESLSNMNSFYKVFIVGLCFILNFLLSKLLILILHHYCLLLPLINIHLLILTRS